VFWTRIQTRNFLETPTLATKLLNLSEGVVETFLPERLYGYKGFMAQVPVWVTPVGLITILLGSVKFNTGDPPRIPLFKGDLYSPLFKGG
jgi:hypothetical protein